MSAELVPTIGLEIHVQLLTRTKMFCGCELEFGAEPNVHTCPVCLGHPGTLPVPNEQAIEYAIRIAVALGCEIAPRSGFHRKNYFYPDLPKGYQISQFDVPLATAGRLGGVRIHRVHLEEDAAKLSHVGETGRIHGSGASLVDFNRGGTPLVEIVTEPDIDDPAAAREWLALLRTTLRQLGVSDVNMEEGSLRCDANVSIRPAASPELGVKTELKNMNSFRYLERGVEAEIARQREIVESGGAVEQETLHFDPAGGTLTPLRSKEYAHDYRYFPEPDLAPVAPSAAAVDAARASLPELPEQRRDRYEADLGLKPEVARRLAFDASLAAFFEEAVTAGSASAPAALANWITGDLVALARERGLEPAATAATPAAVAALVGLLAAGEVNRGGAREVLEVLVRDGGEPAAIVDRLDLGAGDPDELAAIVKRAIEEDADAAAKVRAGEGKAIGALVGAVMRETRGKADGGEVTRLIREQLDL
ncbi:MAG: Asp-tRNA(Asn)/Glu-tRNA(Gln) amidotransferase subunit GatB [Thermoleophilia bacterium]|nr:Asp-tRNA(Asn)/Glu-tRNA(Gln) amidotransferase subunit GatB [Thermoleophilia bacterium]